jgi:hypothetical protein
VTHRRAVPRRPSAGRRLGNLLFLALLLVPAAARGQLDDSRITINSVAEAGLRRQALISFVWGSGGFPFNTLAAPTLGVPSPLDGLPNVRRVDELRTRMDAGVEGIAYHFVPQQTNGRLVIVHNGHSCALTENGVRETIAALLAANYAVLAVFMPRLTPYDCAAAPHDPLFTDPALAPAFGSPLRYFLEPVAASINYLRMRSQVDHFPLYREIDMVGISGGGWTTTVYAALDTRIRVSVAVAGTMPLYSRAGSSMGDLEQTLDDFYRIAGYPDLYLLGSRTLGRSQVWLLNRHDTCCFGERADMYRDPAERPWDEVVRDYEAEVRQGLVGPAPAGTFRLVIDETAESHLISPFAIDVILSELARSSRGPRRR